MSEWRDCDFSEKHGGPGLWFLLCPSCPMHAEKVEVTGNDAKMACMGGPREGDRLGVFAVCWHTDKNAVRRALDESTGALGWQVECRFSAETDHWNWPGGKIGAPRLNGMPIPAGSGTETLGEVVARFRRGNLLGDLKP